MQIVNNKSNKIRNITFILTALLYSFNFILIDLGISLNYVIIFCSILFTLFFVMNIRAFCNFRLRKENFLIFFVAFLILIRISDFSYITAKPLYVYSMVIMALNMCLFSNDIKSCNAVSLIMLIPGCCVAFIILLCKFAPSIYFNTIFKIISVENQNGIKYLMSEGYGVFVANNIGLTATYLVISIFLTLTVFIKQEFGLKKLCFYFLLIFEVFALVVLNRRGELVAVFLSLLAYYALMLRGKKLIIFLSLIIIVAYLAILLIALISSNVIVYEGDNRIITSIFELIKSITGSTATKSDISNGRVGLYKIAIKLFKENFIFGIGWGAFAKHGSQYITQVTNVHDIYLQLLCELGVVLGLLFIVLLFAFLFTFKKENKYNNWAFLMFLYILILGVVDNTIYEDHFWLLFSIIYLFRNIKCNKDYKKIRG